MKDGFDWDSIERELFESADERWHDSVRATTYRRRADRIASLILHSDMPPIDIEIEIRSFRAAVLEEFPDRVELFEAIYMSRFRRMWEQFRPDERPLFPDES
jgi:hypothetical protein